MKVLYIVHSTDMSTGANKSFLALIENICKQGVVPFFVTPDKGDLYHFLQKKGYYVLSVSFRLSCYPDLHSFKDGVLFLPRLLGRRFLEHRAYKRIIQLCRQEDIQLIHTNVSILSFGLAAAKELGIPHILHFREYGDLDFGCHYYPSKKVFYQTLAHSLSYSICITKGIQKYHHQTTSHTQQIYNGIQPSACQVIPSNPLNSTDDRRYFLFAGRLEPSKGALLTLQAFFSFCQEHPQNDILLKMAGGMSDVSYLNKLKTFIHEHQLQEKVQLLGNRKDLDVLMREALGTIVASEFEAFGRCLPEAMLNNSLTIGRDTAGTKEQYDNGLELCGQEIGLRFSSTQELAGRMSEVATAPAGSFDEMKTRAKKTVKALYSSESCALKVFNFYQQILKPS